MSTQRITVPVDYGVELTVTLRGDGPLLLFLPGGIGLSTGYAPLIKLLSESFTLAMYDRRGHGPKAIPDPARMTVAQHGADAAVVIEAIQGGQANVLGSSTGAVIGLELAAQFPHHITRLIAHEPPLAGLLEDADRWLAWYDDLVKLAELGEVRIAAEYFFANLLSDGHAEQPPIPLRKSQLPDWDVYLRSEVPRVVRYTPAVTTLGDEKVLVAYGADSTGYWHARSTQALAEMLGTDAYKLPGGHLGPAYQPVAFAEAITRILL